MVASGYETSSHHANVRCDLRALVSVQVLCGCSCLQVAGHAVYVGKDYSEATKEASWFLEEYQKVPGKHAD